MGIKQIILDEVIIPYAIYNEKRYYPIKYVLSKFLLKANAQLYTDDMYKPFIKKLEIDWSFKNTVPQVSNCMNEDGWKLYLDNCKCNKNKTKEKANRFNILCRYVGSKNRIHNKQKVYDNYTLDCIDYIKNISPNVTIKKCLECNRDLPQTSGFFVLNKKGKQGYYYKCKMCQGGVFSMKDEYLEYIYKNFGDEGYLLNKKSDIKFYDKYLHNNTDEFKLVIKDLNYRKELFYKLVKHYYKNGQLKDDDFTIPYIFDNIKIKYPISSIYINDLYEYCTDKDCTERPWLYKNYTLGSVSIERAKNIIQKYTSDKQIIVNDIFNFDYTNLLKQCRLTQFLSDILDFVVKLYDYKYPGYKFKINSVNYYKNNANCIFDMSWLIENELHLDINKIPLYITKTFLHEQHLSLYNVLNKSYYGGNLFKWINECYPNKFIEQDFNINKYRIEFDSLEESQVDRILRDNINNVIYNIRNSKNEVVILDMKPDWILLTPKGCYLCEYFGMYLKKQGGEEFQERLKAYKTKTEKKFKKYKKLLKLGYKHLYIFPEDLKNDYEILKLKIDKIK